jgi:hypothetical protein
MTALTPSPSGANDTSSVLNRMSAPSARARGASMGSSAFCVMKRRSVGLRSLTNSLSVGMSQFSSLPGNGLHRHDGAVGLEAAVRLLPHRVLDTERADDLHRALVDHRGARVDGAAGMPLDDQRRNAVARQQRGGKHADQAPARR